MVSWHSAVGVGCLAAPSVRRTLVVVHHVPQVVSAGVMRLAHAHRVVRQIDITVVAYKLKSGVSNWSMDVGLAAIVGRVALCPE